MRDVATALSRALGSLRQPGMLWHMVWPALTAFVLWLAVVVGFWTPIVDTLMRWLSYSFIGAWMSNAEWLAAAVLMLVQLAVIFAVLPLTYVTATILVSVLAIPMMLERVAKRDYQDIEQRKGGSNLGSAWNAVAAGVRFVVLLLLSLPLWLIPGAGLLISVALTAWLNRRTFSYDALMLHADPQEMQALPQQLRTHSLVLGAICALLAHVPFLNLFAPALSGLAFVHFMLEGLRGQRRQPPAVASAIH